MFKCPFCGDQVESGAVQCPRCGIAIEWQGGEPHFDDPGDSVTLIKLFDPAQQALIESLLQAAGVEYVIQGDVMQDVMGLGRLAGGYNQIFGPPVIKVPKAALEAAREAIASATEPTTILAGEDDLPFDEAAPKPE
jgi:hypothetical protein